MKPDRDRLSSLVDLAFALFLGARPGAGREAVGARRSGEGPREEQEGDKGSERRGGVPRQESTTSETRGDSE